MMAGMKLNAGDLLVLTNGHRAVWKARPLNVSRSLIRGS